MTDERHEQICRNMEKARADALAAAESRGFARGIEAAAKWHEERAKAARVEQRYAAGLSDQLAHNAVAERHAQCAAAIRALAKGETR